MAPTVTESWRFRCEVSYRAPEADCRATLGNPRTPGAIPPSSWKACLAIQAGFITPEGGVRVRSMKQALDSPTLSLMALICGYFIIVGAEVFGHMVAGAIAFEAPPRSLAMFEGPYGYDSAAFWDIFPPITAALFVLALALNWNGPRRTLILIAFIGFLVIGATSYLYVYPQFRDIVYVGFSDTVDPELRARALRWTTMAWVRWAITVIFGFLLLIALRRPSTTSEVSGSALAAPEDSPARGYGA